MTEQERIEAIVRQVVSGMKAGGSTSTPSGTAPQKSRVAMLTAKERFEIQEYAIPEIGDDDVLVKMEGCGVCGTDAHEFKRDPFGLIPVVLGHEGTGEIVKIGKNVKLDSAGKPLGVGDKVVTCMIFKDNPDITMFDLNKQNVGGADVYGLLPDDDIHLNGWFADYIVVRKGSTIFNVSNLDLDSRILIEPAAVLIHAVERAKTTDILRFNSRVAVQGCGPIGLLCIAVLRTMGIENITAVDGNEQRLEFAKLMGATATVNFKNYADRDALANGVKIPSAAILPILPSSAPVLPWHMRTSISLFATAADFASSASSSTAETLPSTRTLISAQRRSPPSAHGSTPCAIMRLPSISLSVQRRSGFRSKSLLHTNSTCPKSMRLWLPIFARTA